MQTLEIRGLLKSRPRPREARPVEETKNQPSLLSHYDVVKQIVGHKGVRIRIDPDVTRRLARRVTSIEFRESTVM